jgi:NADH-quinone oxidoreductase subunit J
MTIPQIAFAYFSFGAVVCSVVAITRKNPLHAVLWVLALFGHIAGIYIFLNAEFLAAIQIIVYAGAILVLYLFVIMLLNLRGDEFQRPFEAYWPVGLLAGGGFILLVAWAVRNTTSSPPLGEFSIDVIQTEGIMMTIGKVLYTQYLLPFEVASLVLLAAIVGAVVLAKKTVE